MLLVAFGTSVPEALPSFKAVDASFKAAFPDTPVVWSYTSQIIRKKLAKQGKPVGGISDGLAALAKAGVKVVRVQSLHVMPGEEFTELERAVLLDIQKHPGRFEAVYLGRPLLESHKDALSVAKAVLADMGDKRRKGEAVVLMGHGQAHGRADLVFEGTRATFKESDPLVFMATVEGDIHDIGKNIVKMLLDNYGYTVFDLGRDVDPQEVLKTVRERDIKLVGLSALMTTTVVAMEETIKLLHAEVPGVKIIVGGAVLTPEYAKQIGADYYAKDAAESARIAEEVFGQ